MYKGDIDEETENKLRSDFSLVVSLLKKLDDNYSLKKTRFKQRADLYTLFHFIYSNKNLTKKSFRSYYNILRTIAEYIRPSQEKCDPLRDYARNCVSQSNSVDARKERSKFIDRLLRNPKETPNLTQKEIIKFLDLSHKLISPKLIEIEGAWTIDCKTSEKED